MCYYYNMQKVARSYISYQYFPFIIKMTKCDIKTLDKDYKSKSYFKKTIFSLNQIIPVEIKIFYLLDFFFKNG